MHLKHVTHPYASGRRGSAWLALGFLLCVLSAAAISGETATISYETLIRQIKLDERYQAAPDSLYGRLAELYREIDADYRRIVVESDRYDPDNVLYASVLLNVLEPFGNDTESFPACAQLESQYYMDYRVEWEELPYPIHDVWPLIRRFCRNQG